MVHRAGVLLVLVLALVLPASADAATATLGGATNITNTSATLNGSITTTSSDSVWSFIYGTSPTSLTHHTPAQPVGAVSGQAVSANVTGLQAGTTYYYRLAVVENASNSNPTTTTSNEIGNFTTTGTSPGGNGVATTGNATSVTATSAVLNGVANSNSDDSGWAFQYGTSTAYGKITSVQVIGSGPHAVSIQVSGLKPNTTYHFRLVVNEGTYPRQNQYGADKTFRTSGPGGFGKASLGSRKLIVHRKRVGIKVKCSGAAGAQCKGKLAITARGKIKGKLKTVGCGTTRFNLKAGKKKTLRPRVSKGCLTLLSQAKNHKIHGRLKGTFSTNQKKLSVKVTLTRR